MKSKENNMLKQATDDVLKLTVKFISYFNYKAIKDPDKIKSVRDTLEELKQAIIKLKELSDK